MSASRWRMIAAALACTACGSSSSGGTGGAPSVNDSNFTSVVAAALCGNLQACCQLSGFGYDAAACQKAVEVSFDPGHAGLARSFNTSAASACVDKAKQAAIACHGVVDFACNAYPGTSQPGEPCESNFDCAKPGSGAVMCDFTTLKCLALDHGKAGDVCTGSCLATPEGSHCSFDENSPGDLCYASDGLYCGNDGRCGALLHAGEACGTDAMCGASMYCDPATGTCATRIAAGGRCPDFAGCVYGGWCDPDSGICKVAPDSSWSASATLCGGTHSH